MTAPSPGTEGGLPGGPADLIGGVEGLKGCPDGQTAKVPLGKCIHGVFAAKTLGLECNKKVTHMWLKVGRLSSETEGLIVAAQDGVVHTAAYRARVAPRW